MKIAPKQPELGVEEVSVIMLGDFNPTIFQPMWFAKEGLLRDSEATDAKITVVHQDVTGFSTDWFALQVTRDQFSASIKADAYIPHFSDLVRGVFQKLTHTPVRKMGINIQEKVRFKSEEDWHAFGHFLLPKSPWKGVAGKVGMRSVQMQCQGRDDAYKGFLLVIVEPQLATKSDAMMRVNDHYEVADEAEQKGAVWATKTLEAAFQTSIERSRSMIDALISNFLATQEVDNGG